MKPTLLIAAFAGLMSISTIMAQNIEAMERTLKKSIEKGHITEDQAEAMLDALHEHDEVEDEGENVEEQIEEWVEKVGEKIDQAVEDGDLTEDEAWDKWEHFKEKQLEPKIEHCLDEGLVSEEWVEELELGIEMAEVEAMLEAAVESGEMTEKQAWKQWIELYGDEEEEDDEDDDDDEEGDDDEEDD